MPPKFHGVPYRLHNLVDFFLFILYKTHENQIYALISQMYNLFHVIQKFNHKQLLVKNVRFLPKHDRLTFSQNETKKLAPICPWLHVFKMII